MPLISYIIRTFFLPNPFSPLGDMAAICNYICGIVLIPLTYQMVGAIYRENSRPAIGSFLFLAIYSINTGVIYGICLMYPYKIIMALIAIGYLIAYFRFTDMINNY